MQLRHIENKLNRRGRVKVTSVNKTLFELRNFILLFFNDLYHVRTHKLVFDSNL